MGRGTVDAEAQLSFGSMQGGQRTAHPQVIERLVAALMAHAVDVEARMTEPGIVLDLTVEGVRCLLIRCDAPSALAILSPREREIARMVADGLTNKTIAYMLEISPWTVSTHLRRIFAKLSVTSRAAMVAQLVLEGLPRDSGSLSCHNGAHSDPACMANRTVRSRTDRHAPVVTPTGRH
jgi:DNA-binding CsgD family transcriptional regulator